MRKLLCSLPKWAWFVILNAYNLRQIILLIEKFNVLSVIKLEYNC